MKLYTAITAALFALAMSASADPSKIGAMDAKQYYGQEMIVTGTVAQVSIRPGIVFLNMDKPYPRSPFTLVIFPANTNRFGDLKTLKGASVEVKGKIVNYHNRPEIVLEKSSQLTVTGKASENSAPER
jgi:DNA/RNA endonuclease YhcR with UshA esterase domain